MLKYLFTAYYRDGTTFQQNPEDISTQDPLRSAFFDVDHSSLIGFSLSDQDHFFAVDLRDGSFIIDNVRFRMHEEEILSNFRLIFFRRHTHHFNQQLQEQNHTIVYRLGWQANDLEGKNVQHVMEID